MVTIEQPQRRLSRWFKTVAGEQLLEHENDLLAQGLQNLFGYHLATLGALDYARGLAASPITHQVILDADSQPESAVQVLASQYDLPLQTDSVDVIIMPHLLETSEFPHHILREAERVIMPDGHIVILGFNPISCYGLCRAVLGLLDQMPWQGHYYHPVRLRDWLQLLGFRIKAIEYCGFVPPIQHAATQQRLSFMEQATDSFVAPLGSVYMIVARNQTVTPNVMKTTWKSQRAPINKGVVEPTTRIRAKHGE